MSEWQWARVIDADIQGIPEHLVLNKLVEIKVSANSEYVTVRGIPKRGIPKQWFRYRFKVISALELLAGTAE